MKETSGSVSISTKLERIAKMVKSSAKLQPGDLECLRGPIEAGKLKAVIDRRYALEDVRLAHEYVEKGNVVITIVPEDS